jgi:hypothetical protein
MKLFALSPENYYQIRSLSLIKRNFLEEILNYETHFRHPQSSVKREMREKVDEEVSLRFPIITFYGELLALERWSSLTFTTFAKKLNLIELKLRETRDHNSRVSHPSHTALFSPQRPIINYLTFQTTAFAND